MVVEAEPDLRIPGYTLGDRLGAGGFGTVFRARHDLMGRDVAIKILHPRYSTDAEALRRFVGEARAVARISHAGIVEVFDFGRLSDGRQYCVMELLDGRTLRQLLDHPLEIAEALRILALVGDAVDAAHAAGVAHRDLKPDNVFVLPSGGVKLIDFGLAKLASDEPPVTETGGVFGTPLYMSPEQCRGRAIDTRTDLYSFGALAYHVLAGRPPFEGDALALALHHLNDTPDRPSQVRPELSASIDRAVLALLAKDPAARPRPLRDVVAAMSSGSLPRPRRWIPLTAIAVGAAVVGGSVFAVRSCAGPDVAPDAAAKQEWSVRKLAVATANPIVHAMLTPDARGLLYLDNVGYWRFDLATSRAERLKLANVDEIDPVSDTEYVGSIGGYKQVASIDLRSDQRRTLFDGMRPAISPDRGRVSGLSPDGWIVVHDLATSTTKKLVEVYGNVQGSAHWSPDGTTLLWSQTGPDPKRGGHSVLLTDARTGHTVPVPVDFSDKNSFSAFDWLPDRRITYCTETSLVAQQPSEPATSAVTLAELGMQEGECLISTQGDKIAVVASSIRASFGVIDLRVPSDQPRSLRAIAGTGDHAPLLADGEQFYGKQGDKLERISFAGDVEPIDGCPGALGFVELGSEILQVTRDVGKTSTTLTVRDAACKPRVTWEIPSAEVSMPACRDTICTAAGLVSAQQVAWRLELDGRVVEIARVAENQISRHPDVAISPDGKRVAFLPGVSNVLHLVGVDGGPVEAITLPGTGAFNAIEWGADPRLLVSTQAVGNELYAVWFLAEDRSRTHVWSSAVTMAGDLVATPDGSRVAVRTIDFRQEFFLVEPR